MLAKTALATRRIAMRARHIMGKSALVKIDNRTRQAPISLNFLLEDTPFVCVRLRMFERFFYMSN